MHKTKQTRLEGFRLLARVEALRSDQQGSLTLLAGMMVFMVTIFAIIAFDTNMAIYNRIVAQNAVDSAADSAALWQARGCNLLQQLNNLHYTVDEGACIAEGVAAGACVASAALLAVEPIPIIGEAAAAARPFVCLGCDLLPAIDAAQHLFYDTLMPIQQGIVDVTPILAFAYANANAYGSGADNLLESATQYLAGIGSDVAEYIPGLGGISSILNDISGSIGGVLGSIPIYAMPLDPTSLDLYVKPKDNDGSQPLYWPSEVGEIGNGFGEVGCADMGYGDAESFVGYDADGDESRENGDSYHPQWGWNDQYYYGWPGFMTWIAGKKQQDELLGLGSLKWLNGGTSPAETEYSFMNQQNLSMYKGSITVGGTPLQIPGFIAIASSQVEGTPVICNGDVDAQGKLIKVYIPTTDDSFIAADKYFIYH